MAIEVPVRRSDGSVRLVLTMTPALDAFQVIIDRQLAGEHWRVKLDRPDRPAHRACPCRQPPVGGLAAPGFLHAWSAAPKECGSHRPENGVSIRAGLHPFAGVRLDHRCWHPESAELTGPPWQAAMVTFGVGLGVLALALFLAQLVSRSIIRPISALTSFASRAEGLGEPLRVDTGLGRPTPWQWHCCRARRNIAAFSSRLATPSCSSSRLRVEIISANSSA